MNGPVPCGQELLLQADFDGELDAAQAAQFAAHRAQCPQCQAAAERLAEARARMRGAPRHAAPAELRDRVLAGIAPAAQSAVTAIRPRRVRSVSTWLAGALGGALAATLLVALLVNRGSGIEDRLLDSHLRALRSPALLTDVVASSHHTVKPWFAGKLSYAPVVKDLDGYTLLGGRVDVVDGRQVAVIVYRAGPHVIDVFEWPASAASTLPLGASRDSGFNLRHWTDGDMTFWCVSDLAPEELDAFVAHWRRAT